MSCRCLLVTPFQMAVEKNCSVAQVKGGSRYLEGVAIFLLLSIKSPFTRKRLGPCNPLYMKVKESPRLVCGNDRFQTLRQQTFPGWWKPGPLTSQPALVASKLIAILLPGTECSRMPPCIAKSHVCVCIFVLMHMFLCVVGMWMARGLGHHV